VDLSTQAFLALEPKGGTVGIGTPATITYLKAAKFDPTTGKIVRCLLSNDSLTRNFS
jgi:hypothetical protein